MTKTYILVLSLLCFSVHYYPVLADPVDSADTTPLDEIVVEQELSTETELPLGTKASGDTLKDATGSSGDPFRGLQALPGFAFIDDENADPAVRGARPGDNLYEVDFIPVTYLSHADNAVSVFNSDLIESFNIYSSAYGPEFSGVSGGVFDVRLRDPAIDRFHTTVDVNFLHSGILLEGPVTEKQSFYLAGRFSYLDVFVEDQLNDDTEYIQFPEYTDYQSKYVWRFADESTLRFQAIGANDDFEAVVPISVETGSLSGESIPRDFESSAFNQQGLVLDARLTDNITTRAVAAYTESELDEQNGSTAQFSEDTSQSLMKSYLDVTLNENHTLSFGAALMRDKTISRVAFDRLDCPDQAPECDAVTTTRVTTTERSVANRYHVFIKDSWFAGDRLTLFPGVVLQSETRSGRKFVEPRFALEYSANRGLLFTAGVGVNHQRAEQFQLSQLYGNPELDYIESVDWVVGAQKKFASGWSVKTELFYKELDNLVQRDDVLVYNNAGEGQAYGIEGLIRKEIGEKLSGWMAVSFSDASRKRHSQSASYPFAFDQPYNISLLGKYQWSANWDIGAKLWLHSGAPYTPIVGTTENPDGSGDLLPIFGELNGSRYPSYQRLDVRINRTFEHSNNRKTIVSLEVLNLLDRKNVSYYRYNSDFQQTEPVYQLPRIFGLGLTSYF